MTKRPPRRGRPLAKVDLRQVERLAALGFTSMTEIGRTMGVPRQTLQGPTHYPEVREAFERGRVKAKRIALEQYEAAIKSGNGNLTGLLIFKMKQHGWTDRLTHDGTIEVTDGARERILDAIEKIRAKKKTEA